MNINAPPPIDSQILEFKQLFKLKTENDGTKKVYKNPTQLVATSSFFGLTFVGEQNAVKVIIPSNILEGIQDFNPATVLKNYTCRIIPLPSSPTHIDVNSDQKLLSVIFNRNEIPILRIYNIKTIFEANITIFKEVILSSNNGTFVRDFCWNPSVSNILTCCISDGTLSVYTFSENNFEIKTLPKESCSTCACWSPKGKQIVIGNYNGYITQYLPELKAVKSFEPPSGIFEKPCSVCNIKWLSSFQFICVYKLQEQHTFNCEEKTSIIVVNTPKNGPVTYIDYGDICFSSGTDRPCQFYFIHIPSWNLIFVASANAVEVAVLSLNQDGITWCQWNLDGSARIELPMCKTEETFPVGIAIDYSSQIQTTIDKNVISMPILNVLTCEGVLCVYMINYLHPMASGICIKAQPISNLDYFTSNFISDKKKLQDDLITFTTTSHNNGSGSTLHVTNLSFKSDISEIKDTQVSSVNTVNIPSLLTSTSSFIKPNSGDNIHFRNTDENTVTTDKNSFSSTLKSENVSAPKSVNLVHDISDVSISKIIQHSKPIKKINASFKKFKEAVVLFENDIQEIKYLIKNIEVENKEDYFQNYGYISKLEEKVKKLKLLNLDLCNEIENIKLSIIKTFACVQDVKTKHFQLINLGYNSLSNIQDLDPIDAAHLKIIENNINYVQSQIEKGDKQLDELWFKFKENISRTIVKTPILDNIFRTVDKQQKILKMLECRTEILKKKTEKLQKRIILLNYGDWKHCRMVLKKQHNHDMNVDSKIQSNDDSLLSELTRKVLHINSRVDNQMDAKKLVHLYSIEHARRYHLSHTKQIKLQELYCSGSITFIQSNRLQRLKKKSLLILSKTSCTVEIQEKNDFKTPKSDHRQIDMISPVSFDEHEINNKFVEYENVINQNLISSTPMKNILNTELIVDNISLAEDSFKPPSQLNLHNKISYASSTATSSNFNIFQTDTSNKLADIKFPSIVTPSRSVTQDSNIKESSQLNVTSSVLNKITCSDSSRNFISEDSRSKHIETINFPSSASINVNSKESLTPVSNVNKVHFFGSVATLPSVTVTTSFSISTFTATVPSNVTSLSSSYIKSNNTNITVPSMTNSVAAFPFSFNSPKIDESITKTIETTSSTTVPIFSGKILAPNSNTPPSISSSSDFEYSTNSSFKAPSSTTCFVTLVDNIVDRTCTTITPVVTQTANMNECTILKNIPFPKSDGIAITPSSTSTIFGGTGSIFGKPNTSTNNTINFGSVLSSANTIYETKESVALSASVDKANETFSTFNFANKKLPENSVTISEISSEIGGIEVSEKNKDNSVLTTVTLTSSNMKESTSTIFTFALPNSPLSFTAVKSDTYTVVSNPSCIVIPNNVSCAGTVISNANNSSVISGSISTLFTSSSSFVSPDNSITTGTIAIPSTTILTSVTSVASNTTVTTTSTMLPMTITPTTTTSAPDLMPISISSDTISTMSPKISVPSVFENTGGTFFSNLNISSTSTTANATLFGKPVSTSTSIFGGGNIFSQNANTSMNTAASVSESKSIFGSRPASSLFGQANVSVTENKSLFPNFQNNGSSLFGNSSLFGGGSNFANTSSTIQTTSFNTNSGSPLFGSNSSSFSSLQGNSLFQNASDGFSQQLQNTSSFGSPPSFSSVFHKTNTPSFPSFGGNPTFGGSPTFGTNHTKIFGQTSNLGTFGNSSTQHATTFENLASENTISFGNLAQQQSTGFGTPPTFGTPNNNTSSPSFNSPSFGGNSFSSWRS